MMDSLVSMCLEVTIKNATPYLHPNGINLLPNHLKNRLLKKFLSSNAFCGSSIDLNTFLTSTINPTTALINLSNINCSGIKLDILQKASNLKQLYLTNAADNSITTADLLNLFQQTKCLAVLHLEKCSHVTDEVLYCIAEHCPQMRELNLANCKKITDDGVVSLRNLPLVSLSLAYTKVTSDGISEFATGTCSKTLKELNLKCSNFEPKQSVLFIISKHCRLLTGLNFNSSMFDLFMGDSPLLQAEIFNQLNYFTCTMKW